MIGRSTSSLLASILVLAQLLAGPLTHAAPLAMSDQDCGPTRSTADTVTAGMTNCGGCPDEQTPPAPRSPGGDHHCRTHAACTCPCAHTPALSSSRLLVASPTPPEDVLTVLAAPAFDPPLFDFLRPPN